LPDELGTITRLLNEAHEGRKGALDEVMELVYADLNRLAEKRLHQQFGPDLAGITLEPAALVHETYLKLIKQRKRYDSRGHFFAIATRVMQRILLDYHRKKSRQRRGGDQIRVSLSGVARRAGEEPSAEIPAFVEALDKLGNLDQRTGDVTKLRLIWGLTVPEIAEAIELSVATVEREWRFARKWLAAELAGG
jgi:RNA polymerase sigma factor (TIGR02999 family)